MLNNHLQDIPCDLCKIKQATTVKESQIGIFKIHTCDQCANKKAEPYLLLLLTCVSFNINSIDDCNVFLTDLLELSLQEHGVSMEMFFNDVQKMKKEGK